MRIDPETDLPSAIRCRLLHQRATGRQIALVDAAAHHEPALG